MKAICQPWRKVLLAAGIGAVAAGPLSAADVLDKSTGLCRTVQANVPWQGTGISVAPGQFVCVAADGLWSHGGQGLQAITPFYGAQG
jgi:hypothetical protein